MSCKKHKQNKQNKQFLCFTARKSDSYIPNVYPKLFVVYCCSCFFYLIPMLALIYNKCYTKRYGLALIILLFLQCFASYSGDVVEFMNTGKYGVNGIIDKCLANVTAITSFLFIFNNNFVYWSLTLYFSLFFIGLIFWFIQLTLIRIECDVPNLWCSCHILWHILPSIGSVFLIFSNIN